MEKKNKIIGAGIGIAAIAALGAYFLAGKRGAKNRAKIAGWALGMKEEVLEKMRNLKEFNQEAYNKLIDETADRYRGVKKVSAAELRHLTKELKAAWKHISKKLA